MVLGSNSEQVFRGRYAFNENETWGGLSQRVGTGLASVETNPNFWGEKFSQVIHDMTFLPAGRILRNTGRPRGTLLNCFSLDIDDSIRSIAYQCAKALILWSEGGGVGFNFSNLRPEDAVIVQKGGFSSGPISFLKHYDGGAQTIKTGGDRRAAALGLMIVSHPDIIKFIKAKRVDGALENFNLSVGITESFLDAVEQGKDWDLKFNHKVYQTLPAHEIWDLMMEYMIKYGDPGLINWDNLRSNNSYYFAKITSTNPCGESPLASGESCDLGSLVLPNFITGTKNTNWELMKEVIFTSVRMLDNVLTLNRYALEENKDMSMAGRRIGIGIMGLAEYLFAKKLRYGSEGAINATEYLMKKIRNYCYEASIQLAEEKGAFPKFDSVMYMKAHFIRNLPAYLRTDIKKYGIRNVTTMAIAPTGCLVEDTLISSNKGYKPICKFGDINTTHPTKLSSDFGISHFKQFFDQGIANTIKITTDLGYSIEGTYDHKVRVISDGNGYIWKKLKDISDNDYVVLKKGHIFKEETWVRDEVSELLGFYMADGWWSIYGESSRRLYFKINEKEVNYIVDLLKLCFQNTYGIEPIVRNGEGKSKLIEVNSKKLYNWFLKYHLIKNGADNAFIPDIILNGNKNSILNFIRGFFKGDGGFNLSKENLKFTTTSVILANQLHTLLLGIGIPSNLYEEDNRDKINEIKGRSFKTNLIAYRIEVTCYYSRLLCNILNISSQSIDQKWEGKTEEKVIILPHEERKFNEIYKIDDRDIFYVSHYQYNKNINEKNWFIKNNLIMDRVRKIKNYNDKHVYDLEVNEVTHTYVANGFITHNTISLIPEVTGSAEPLPFKAYIRHDRIGDRAYIHPVYQDLIKNDELCPEWFVDSADLTPVDHLEQQSIIQKYTDGAISKTINVPNDTTHEQLSSLLKEYMRDLKGATVYRDGSKEGQILVPITREDAQEALLNDKADSNLDEETVQCASGKCEL